MVIFCLNYGEDPNCKTVPVPSMTPAPMAEATPMPTYGVNITGAPISAPSAAPASAAPSSTTSSPTFTTDPTSSPTTSPAPTETPAPTDARTTTTCTGGVTAAADLREAQAWVTQNFNWLYIITQDVWVVFLLWLCFSKYGNIKLGADDEKPVFSDVVWFMLLFTCGLGIGLFYWGVSEPIYYYRGYAAMQKPGFVNEDQRAQQAIFITLFHWGLHGWIPYILCAVNMGVVCFRNGHPLSLRYCFQPLLGDKVTNGVFGDFIDAVSISCTTFGVCTSLGMGAESIAQGINRLNPDVLDPTNTTHKCWIIAAITFVAMCSVLTGLNKGIKSLASLTFMAANFFLLICLFSDNTWYLLNVIVQSIGHYFQVH